MQLPSDPRIDLASRTPPSLAAGEGRAALVLLLLCCNKAYAAALGKVATSIGLFATLAALVAIKGWPAVLAPSALSTGGALVIGGAAVWWWRTRLMGRAAGFAPLPGPVGGAALCRPGAGAVARAAVLLPPGIDRDLLLAQLRRQFMQVQEAWDRHEMPALQELMTPEMLAEVCREVTECRADGARAAGSTDIVVLRCDLVGFETLTQASVASVEFSGLMRESAASGAVPFRELWMLTRSKDAGMGWRLARHQTLL